MRLDAILRRQRSAVGDSLQLFGAGLALAMGITASVELDDRRAEPDRRLDLLGRRLDEQADADACVQQARDDRLQAVVMPVRVEAALGGPLLALFGDDAGRVRTMAEGYLEHLVGRRHFEVQRQLDRLHQPGDIVVGDVPPVLAEVRGDAIRARGGGDPRRLHRVRVRAAARVADRRDVIDVHAETKSHAARPLLPGLTGGSAASSGGSWSAG